LKASADIKQVASYRAVKIPDGSPPAGADKAQRAELDEKDVKWLALDNIRSGDFLARDIYGDEQGVLLGAGTEFTAGVLQKLADLRKMSAFNGPIAVKRGSSS
ncbi:MAG: hypothetical protein ACYCZX_03760, partial [Rhodospirillaceae bacterium]